MSSTLDQLGIEITGGQIIQRLKPKKDSDECSSPSITKQSRVLIPKAIEKGQIIYENIAVEEIETEPDARRITHEGDIVIKLSTPYDSCYITKEDEGLLVPSFCAIIRNYEYDYKPYYLLAYLNSKVCKDVFANLTAGLTMSLLSPGILKKIVVPKPSDEKQIEIGEEYMNALKKRTVMRKIVSLEDELFEAIFNELEV